MYGKRGLGGGSAAVLDAPETARVQEGPWPVPEPAPAGTLQRKNAAGEPEGASPLQNLEEERYSPRRQSAAHRLRLVLLRSVAGRIVAACCLALIFGLVAAGAILARRLLLHDARFVIATSSDIQIAGNRHLTRAQVLSVFGADLERNIFKIPLAERQTDVERLPWVEHATVMRLLPNRLRIAITERTPIAFVRQGSHIGLVDASGVLLDMPEDVAGDPHYSFPVLTGLSARDPLPVRAARMEVYRRFLRELDSSGERLTQSLSEVDVSDPEDVKAVVTESGGDLLVHFGDEKFLERYKTFSQNLPQWKSQYPKLASVDTRYDSQFVLEMQPGSTLPLPGSVPAEAGPVAAKEAKSARLEPPVRKAAAAAGKAKPLAKPEPAKAKGTAAAKKPILVHAWTPGGSEQGKR